MNNLFKYILVVMFFSLAIPAAHASAATLYFNGGTDNDWNTLSGNWWNDSGFTSPAVGLPGALDDVVINFEGNLVNSGLVPTVQSITVTNANLVTVESIVSGAVIFHGSAQNYGDVTADTFSFFDGSQNRGTITGPVTFQGSGSDVAANAGIINGNVIFDEQSSNHGTINGNVEFKPMSFANGDIYDNSALINGNVISDECTKKNYATITGSITFPSDCRPGVMQQNNSGYTPGFYANFRPIIAGVCSTDDIIKLYIDGNDSGVSTMCDQGNYELIPNQDIPDGFHNISITVTQISIESDLISQGIMIDEILQIMIDTINPEIPVLLSPAAGAYTRAPEVFTGTCEPYNHVIIDFTPNSPISGADADCLQDGTFIIDVSGQPDYQNLPISISLYQIDRAGNSSDTIEINYTKRRLSGGGGGGGGSSNTSSTTTNNSTANNGSNSSCTIYSITATVKRGTKGPNGISVQQAINQMKIVNPLLVIDGSIGPKSVIGIQTAQKMFNLKADGAWGKITQGAYEQWNKTSCK